LVEISAKNDKFGYLKPILAKLGVTHDLGWRLAGKPMVNFLSLIELFSLSITVPELGGKMWTARLFSQGVNLFALKFYLDRVIPSNHSWHQKTRDTGYPMVKTASFCVPSFWHNTAVWWTDRQICRSIYSICKA